MHVLLIRNNEEYQQELGEGQGVKEEDVHTKEESMPNSTSTPPRIPEPYFTKTDALSTYGVGFGHSIYSWNQNFIELPMAPIPPKNSF
jgi:hypothetical protein